jgi:hypothetical protein
VTRLTNSEKTTIINNIQTFLEALEEIDHHEEGQRFCLLASQELLRVVQGLTNKLSRE